LRHRATTRDFHHVIAGFWLGVNPDFFDVGDTFGLQDLFGPNAIGANGGGVHLHLWHEGSNEVFKRLGFFNR
jgi:hypothetical protein